jgi:hypothetical protein
MKGLEASVRTASARALPRAELSAAIVARLDELGAPPAAVASAKKIGEPGSVVVVAGQQPVLFGGPSLVWAKAWDAIEIAAMVEKDYGVPAAPVFWVAAEDHDHTESSHVRMDLGADPVTLRVPLPGDRRMLSRVPVPAEAAELLEMLRAKFPQGPRREEMLAALEPADGDTMGSWFSRIALRLMGRHGLVVVEPATMRPYARPVAEFEITRPGELAASIRRAEADAEARGEDQALDLARDELFFVSDDAGRRLRVARDGARWRIEDGRVLTTQEMLALPPSSISWNVATRVLAQNTALPVAAHVCGPSEIRYCDRLAEAHAVLGIPAPLLVLRTHWWFVTARAARLARELGVIPAVVAEPGDAPAPAPRPRVDPPELSVLRDALQRLSTGGSASAQRRRAALVHGVEAYAEALKKDEEERIAVASARRTRLEAMLRPDGGSQDRVFSPLPWLSQISAEEARDLLAGSVETRIRREPRAPRMVEFGVGAQAGEPSS